MTYNVSLLFFSSSETDNSAKAVKETALFFSDSSLIVTGDTSASGCDTQSPVTFSGINGATVLGNWRDNFKELKCQEGLCHYLEKLRLPVHIVLGFFSSSGLFLRWSLPLDVGGDGGESYSLKSTDSLQVSVHLAHTQVLAHWQLAAAENSFAHSELLPASFSLTRSVFLFGFPRAG